MRTQANSDRHVKEAINSLKEGKYVYVGLREGDHEADWPISTEAQLIESIKKLDSQQYCIQKCSWLRRFLFGQFYKLSYGITYFKDELALLNPPSKEMKMIGPYVFHILVFIFGSIITIPLALEISIKTPMPFIHAYPIFFFASLAYPIIVGLMTYHQNNL